MTPFDDMCYAHFVTRLTKMIKRSHKSINNVKQCSVLKRGGGTLVIRVHLIWPVSRCDQALYDQIQVCVSTIKLSQTSCRM